MHIRSFVSTDALCLREVFFSSVHQLASHYYSDEQIHAWAPKDYDYDAWTKRISALNPYVALAGSEIVGYADLQASGYIDHFFVAGAFAGQGVGTALMQFIHSAAASQSVEYLYSDVSLSAESFFVGNGFAVEARKNVVVRGVSLQNARMGKKLRANRSLEPTYVGKPPSSAQLQR